MTTQKKFDDNRNIKMNITKEEVAKIGEEYSVIFERENHDHPIIVDDHGTYRWKSDPIVNMLFEYKCVDLNTMYKNGASKNDPRVRKFYRDMGYSLYGYWEVFHWDMNNPEAEDYKE